MIHLFFRVEILIILDSFPLYIHVNQIGFLSEVVISVFEIVKYRKLKNRRDKNEDLHDKCLVNGNPRW